MSGPVPSAVDYVQPDEVVTYVDADGNVTEGKARAVGGEIVHRRPDGVLESVVFSLDPNRPDPPIS